MSKPVVKRRASRWALAVGIALIASCFAIHPHATPPLYDGIGFPDEPYRFVNPPSDAIKTKPPAGATYVAKLLSDDSNAAFSFATVEKGPQIKVTVRIGVLQAPAGATGIRAEVAPIRPGVLPSNGDALGNVYEVGFSAVGSTQPVTVNNIATFDVAMRIPVATRDAIALEYFHDGTWTTLQTEQTGNDIYTAALPGAGDVVPVLITDVNDKSLAATAKSGGAQGIVVALIIGVLVVIAVVIFTIRTRGMRERALAQPPSE